MQNEEGEEEKIHDDVSWNMVDLFDDGEDSDLDEPENDIVDQRNIYQLHHQQVFSDDEDHDEKKVYTTLSNVSHINCRKASKEGIDIFIVEMIFQVHSNYNMRNRTVNNDTSKSSGIFIKDITHKMIDDSTRRIVE